MNFLSNNNLIINLNKSGFFPVNNQILKIKPIKGGGNSRVYLVQTVKGDKFICKKYYEQGFLKENRLNREFSSFIYLNKNGFSMIPDALYQNKKIGFGIYEYIKGVMINSQEIAESDISQLIKLFGKLRILSKTKEANDFLPAKEASFSIREVYGTIDRRLLKLQKISNNKLHKFLVGDFIPLYTKIKQWISSQHKLSIETVISRNFWSLSPSDFGFHNAIKRVDGKLIFIDFEYFGFDDPAKTISDFLLHPKNTISHKLKQFFVSEMLKIHQNDPELSERLKIEFPLYGLKWSLIMLNEFIPTEFNRREFAQNHRLNHDAICDRQLAKTGKMMRYVDQIYQKFPYDI
jgi:thiamine kinase-like enzyme